MEEQNPSLHLVGSVGVHSLPSLWHLSSETGFSPHRPPPEPVLTGLEPAQGCGWNLAPTFQKKALGHLAL